MPHRMLLVRRDIDTLRELPSSDDPAELLRDALKALGALLAAE